MLCSVVEHQIQQLVYLANDNALEFCVNKVLSQCVGSTGINCHVKYVSKHCFSSQVFNLAVPLWRVCLQPLSIYIHTYRKGVGLDDSHSKLNVVAIVSCCIAIGFRDCKAFFLVFRLVSEIYRKDQSSEFSNNLCPL